MHPAHRIVKPLVDLKLDDRQPPIPVLLRCLRHLKTDQTRNCCVGKPIECVFGHYFPYCYG